MGKDLAKAADAKIRKYAAAGHTVTPFVVSVCGSLEAKASWFLKTLAEQRARRQQEAGGDVVDGLPLHREEQRKSILLRRAYSALSIALLRATRTTMAQSLEQMRRRPPEQTRRRATARTDGCDMPELPDHREPETPETPDTQTLAALLGELNSDEEKLEELCTSGSSAPAEL